jgi:hypothetical protein
MVIRAIARWQAASTLKGSFFEGGVLGAASRSPIFFFYL